MKTPKLILALLLGCSINAPGQFSTYDNSFSSGFANNGNVPEGSLSGWSDSERLSGESGTITSVTVNLDIAGGYNGSLYAYLTYDGLLVSLLNRVGVGFATPTSSAFGYGDSGFDITLSSSSSANVHFYQTIPGYNINGDGQLTGTWQPDGSAISPLSAPSSFDSSPGAQTLNSFAGLNPNGTWTLYVADVATGGGQSQIDSYGLEITTVPEPGGLLSAGLFLLGTLLRKDRVRKGGNSA
jgi:hypothetical protein